MNNPSSPACPFTVGGKIADRQSFVGREYEISLIISHMQDNHQPSSVSIVGDRQIGKSSLLYHIFQTYEDRVKPQNKDRFVVIYLSLQQANCRTQSGFYQTIAEEILKQSKVKIRSDLADPVSQLLQGQVFDAIEFGKVLAAWQTAGVVLVICLDEFETLFDRIDQFDNAFYDHLRSLINSQCLMLIIASRKFLHIYSRKKKLTSDFFNVFTNCRLKELTDEAAMALVQLPNVQSPALGEDRRSLTLQWGGRNPYLLQRAAQCLWEAKRDDRSVEWAKREFYDRTSGVSRKHPINLVGRGVMGLGDLVKKIGSNYSGLNDFIGGAVILLLLVFILMGKVNWQQIQNLFPGSGSEPSKPEQPK